MSSANTFKQIKANFKDTYDYPAKPRTSKLLKKLRKQALPKAPKAPSTGN